jgi:dTMP kinase
MLIVLEGIDGSGKSTTAAELFRRLSPYFQNSRYRCKTDISALPFFKQSKLELLKNIVWQKKETDEDPFGAVFWILLIAAWYTALEPAQCKGTDQFDLRVYDGWFYRNIVKTAYRCGKDPAWIKGLFESVETPDLVILLDVDPTVAWQRQPNRKVTELGRWDGFLGDRMESFCGYQTVIRSGLLKMATECGWHVVSPLTNSTASDIALELLPVCLTRLSRLRCAAKTL